MLFDAVVERNAWRMYSPPPLPQPPCPLGVSCVPRWCLYTFHSFTDGHKVETSMQARAVQQILFLSSLPLFCTPNSMQCNPSTLNRATHKPHSTRGVQAYVNNERVCVYGPGGSFGELALMYNCERAATVRATAPSRLWTMDLSTFRRSLATTASSQIVSRCEFLRKVPFLAELNNEQVCGVPTLVGYERVVCLCV